MPELVGFVGSFHVDKSLNFDAQRCVNMFPQVSASGTSRTAAKLVSSPGLKVWADLSAQNIAGIRGMLQISDTVMYVVGSDKVYKFSPDGSYVTLTLSITRDTTPVSMSTNGVSVFFVTGTEGYVINIATNVMTKYVDASFTGADAVWFIDGTYVFNQPNTSKFWSMLPYSTTIDSLYFATAEGAPDGLVTLAVNRQEIWLFGTRTIEVWNNSGSAGFPYSRINGVFIEHGCAAKNSVARLDDSLVFLSANDDGEGIVYRTVGYGIERISNSSMEQIFAKYSRIDNAEAYTYQQEGHLFYALTFPTQDVTWVYDMSTKTWHQRAWRKESGQFGRHRGRCHAFFNRKNLVGDWQNGKIYEMSTSVYDDDGVPLVRLRSSPHVAAEFKPIAHNSIQFNIETGVGLQSGQGVDPVVSLRWSDDGGHKWSNFRTASIGKVGEYKKRVRFTRLGQAVDRVYELSISDPVPFTVLGAAINAEQ